MAVHVEQHLHKPNLPGCFVFCTLECVDIVFTLLVSPRELAPTHLLGCRWRSFLRGGSLALYMALYAVGFLFNTLHLLSGFLSVLLYLSYMVLILWAVYLAMGTVGFASSFLFTYKIFASVKAD